MPELVQQIFKSIHLEELGDTAFDGELGGARDFPGRGRGHAGVEAGILGVDVLQNKPEC